MLLRVVVYSKEMEVKLMFYECDPTMQGWEWNVSLFVQWILVMGERKFSRSTTNYNAKFPFKCQTQTITDEMTTLYISFSILQQSRKFDFQCFVYDKKQFYERKTLCSLFKKDSHYDSESTENQKQNEQAITNT